MKKNKKLLAKAKGFFGSLTFLLVSLLLFSFTDANKYKQEDLVKFSYKKKELGQVFETITSATDYKFFYETSEVDLTRKITISKSEISVDELLKELFANSNLNCT